MVFANFRKNLLNDFVILLGLVLLFLFAKGVAPAGASVTEIQVSASSDDAEERATGGMYLDSSDLELVFDKSEQTVGMRFLGVDIPQGATILEAFVQFQVDETSSVATSLTIQGEDTDDAGTFLSSGGNISSRLRTTAAVPWVPVPWTVVGEAGLDQQTPNIASVIQEIVNQPGWLSGNSLVIIITGIGERVAESYDGDPDGAPLLHVDYVTGPPNQPPTATIDTPLDGETYTFGELISFSGSAEDAEDGDLTPSLAWDSDLDGPIGNGAFFSSSDLSLGVHIITATVMDSGGLTDVDQISISVTTAGGNLPPVVSAGPDQTIGLFDNAVLDGTVSDDGLPVPPGKVTTTWSKLSGPGTVAFADANAVDTTASFSEAGSYVLELTADDGELSVSDQVLITVSTASIIRVPQDYPSIQAAIDAAQNGDVVLVSPGTYTENLILSGKTITLASEFYTTQDPSFIDQTIIDGGGGAVITVGASVGPETKIIGLTIQNGDDGISGAGELEILNNRFIDNGDAIDYEGGGGICRDNLFENNSDDAIDLDGPTQAIIEDNIIRNNGDDGIEIRLHEYTGPVLNIIIRNNIISGNEEDGIQVIDYPDLSDRFILIEGNLFEANAMVGLGLMDNGDTTEDFRAASIPERIHVYNNTFIDNDHALTGGDNLIALNNLFVNSISLAMKQVDGNSIAAYNLFWNNGTDEEGSNLDLATTLFADPVLDFDFQLQPGSPAIDAGTSFFQWQDETVLDIPDTEFSGAAPDLGAYESDFGPANQAPAVTISTPADGASFNEGDPIAFSGSALDAEDGDLTASLAWSSSLDGSIGTGGSFSRSDLSPGVHTITASVTDSGGASGLGQITITVNALNTPPEVTISAPADGASFNEGDSITFSGSALDVEDGNLTANLSWSSDLDGGIGTGGFFLRSDLSPGVHTITASVTDSGGTSNSAQITITVNEVNTPPEVTISAPADGASFNEGDPINFGGSALDAEDGDLTASLSWSSSLDGSIGTGGSFSRAALSPGVHIITASVADSGALTGSDQISITVDSAPVLNVTLTDDASVDSKNPTTGFGSSPTLAVRSHRQQIINSYLKFVVSGVNGTVQSAKLRLFSTKKSSSGGAVYLVSNDFLNTATPWNEDGLNFENAPLIEGTALSSVGSVSADSWVEFDVKEAIQADGTYSFGLSTISSNRATYSSKEATVNEPVLFIDTTQ